MKAQRNIHNFWDPRARDRQRLQLVPPVPRMIGPMPLYPLPMPTLLPKPTVRTNRTVEKKSRMEKFTSVERAMLDKTTHVLSKRDSTFGYMQKLVKRGYFKATATAKKHEVRYTITSAGERARAGMALLKSVQGKQGIAVGKVIGHAV